MKPMKRCPKCGSGDIVHVPDNAHRYLANSICITKHAWVKRVPVARCVCCGCGYVENWLESPGDAREIRKAFG